MATGLDKNNFIKQLKQINVFEYDLNLDTCLKQYEENIKLVTNIKDLTQEDDLISRCDKLIKNIVISSFNRRLDIIADYEYDE